MNCSLRIQIRKYSNSEVSWIPINSVKTVFANINFEITFNFFFPDIRDPEIAVNKWIMKYLGSFNRALGLTAIHWKERDDIVRGKREERSNDFGSGRGHLLRSVPTLPLPVGRALRPAFYSRETVPSAHARNSTNHTSAKKTRNSPSSSSWCSIWRQYWNAAAVKKNRSSNARFLHLGVNGLDVITVTSRCPRRKRRWYRKPFPLMHLTANFSFFSPCVIYIIVITKTIVTKKNKICPLMK